ncbi:MAG TPA: ABC-type transport auxiliary lipoprotein family protein [Burkholderiaceae bacterium]|nr:ABC-type transport auxiliary lipoprotein family protein [Burkholderiaceae bacterium]
MRGLVALVRLAALTGALAGALLAGCAAPDQPQRYFVLDEGTAPTRAAPAAAPRDITLLVAPVSAASFYRLREIAYSRAAGERSYYVYSSWTEPPAVAIGAALMQQLEGSGAFRRVAPASAGIDGTLVLRVHLDELYHDAATPPGVARIALTAQLTGPHSRVPIAQRSFTAAAPATAYDADGAVAGMRQALGQALAELVRWVATVQPPASQR